MCVCVDLEFGLTIPFQVWLCNGMMRPVDNQAHQQSHFLIISGKDCDGQNIALNCYNVVTVLVCSITQRKYASFNLQLGMPNHFDCG